jgi:hypothetical protein
LGKPFFLRVILRNQIEDERYWWWDVHWGQERWAQGFGGETEGKKPLGRLGLNGRIYPIKMYLTETEIDGLGQRQLAGSCERCNGFSVYKNAQYFFISWEILVGRDSAVGIATRYGLEGPGIECRWWWDFPHLSRPSQEPTQPRVSGYRVFPGVKGGRGVTLITHSHLVPRSWTSRAIPLLPLWGRVWLATGLNLTLPWEILGLKDSTRCI